MVAVNTVLCTTEDTCSVFPQQENHYALPDISKILNNALYLVQVETSM